MKMLKHTAIIAASIITLLISACASMPPPTDQIALAKSAISNATSAGGNEFAAAEMKSAQDKMALANSAMLTKDYREAKAFAEQAQTDARLAETKAEAAKAQKAADATKENIRVLREEINRNTTK